MTRGCKTKPKIYIYIQGNHVDSGVDSAQQFKCEQERNGKVMNGNDVLKN